MAIAAVVLFHANGYVAARRAFEPGVVAGSTLGRLLGHGHFGVQLFFTISGFILALPFARARFLERQVELKRYFTRRLTRLEPPYLLVLVLYFMGALFVRTVDGGALVPHLLASALYVHSAIYGTVSSVNGVAWSLEVEVQFYLLAPLLAAVFGIRNAVLRRGLMLAIWAAAIAVKSVLPQEGRVALSIVPYFEFFWAGFLLADLHVSRWERRVRALAWDLVSLVGWPILVVLWGSREATQWLFAPMVFVLYAAALRGRLSSRVFSTGWLVTIGGMCYSIYLIHYGVISAVGRFTGALASASSYEATLLLQLVVFVPAVLMVCGTLFVMVERPCMRPTWPRDLLTWWRHRRRANSGAPA